MFLGWMTSLSYPNPHQDYCVTVNTPVDKNLHVLVKCAIFFLLHSSSCTTHFNSNTDHVSSCNYLLTAFTFSCHRDVRNRRNGDDGAPFQSVSLFWKTSTVSHSVVHVESDRKTWPIRLFFLENYKHCSNFVWSTLSLNTRPCQHFYRRVFYNGGLRGKVIFSGHVGRKGYSSPCIQLTLHSWS